MRRAVAVLMMFVVSLVAVAAQTPPAAVPLQGRWVVVEAEHNGQPMKGLNGGVLTVSESAFEVRTASGNVLKGTLKFDATTTPSQMDMVHADGTVWEAIYDVAGDTLRLNYVEKGEKDPRPTAFTTSSRTEASLIVLHREPK